MQTLLDQAADEASRTTANRSDDLTNAPRVLCRRFLAALAFVSITTAALAQPAAPQPPSPAPSAAYFAANVPSPRIDATHNVDWFFAYKFNVADFQPTQATDCAFGGSPVKKVSDQRYVIARSGLDVLVDGPGLIGTSTADAVGATFDEIYNGQLNFVVWNDQFYDHPKIAGCTQSCSGPWGHSKGVIAWDSDGNGLVLQVTTPSWPGSGTASAPRANDGNTLGCVENDNVKFGQHFFALRLSHNDTLAVLTALQNASVVTDVTNSQLARIGGPMDIQALASQLGAKSNSTAVVNQLLSSGVRLIGKPSALHVPPWQLVSAELGGVSLRTATWWDAPKIPSTVAGQAIACWRSDLGTPGSVEIARSGTWEGTRIGLEGGINSSDHNHAKIGISTDGMHHYVIFGDMNQQGTLSGNCKSSQNGRGGLFFVVEDAQLHESLRQFLVGDTAPNAGPSAASLSTARTTTRKRGRRRAH